MRTTLAVWISIVFLFLLCSCPLLKANEKVEPLLPGEEVSEISDLQSGIPLPEGATVKTHQTMTIGSTGKMAEAIFDHSASWPSVREYFREKLIAAGYSEEPKSTDDQMWFKNSSRSMSVVVSDYLKVWKDVQKKNPRAGGHEAKGKFYIVVDKQ